jgi:hypothetical protein
LARDNNGDTDGLLLMISMVVEMKIEEEKKKRKKLKRNLFLKMN